MSALFLGIVAAGIVNIAWSHYWCTHSARINVVTREVLALAAAVALWRMTA